jgi:hypothetical protein
MLVIGYIHTLILAAVVLEPLMFLQKNDASWSRRIYSLLLALFVNAGALLFVIANLSYFVAPFTWCQISRCDYGRISTYLSLYACMVVICSGKWLYVRHVVRTSGRLAFVSALWTVALVAGLIFTGVLYDFLVG